MTDESEPIRESERTQNLHALHHATGQLIALESASKSPRILIDGDIEVAWPEAVKQRIASRLQTRTNEIAGMVRELQSVDSDRPKPARNENG